MYDVKFTNNLFGKINSNGSYPWSIYLFGGELKDLRADFEQRMKNWEDLFGKKLEGRIIEVTDENGNVVLV